jgi:hypothetical protein
MKALFTALVMLYLLVDLGDPNLPGANSFDPDDCVEVVQAQRTPSPHPPALAATPKPTGIDRAPARRIPGDVRPVNITPPPIHAVRHFLPDVSGSEEG